jgi:hypothetical protein
LTLEVDVDGVTKTASNVVEVHCGRRSFPEKQRFCTINGEALYMDLGPGRQPLIALLTRPRYAIPLSERSPIPREIWRRDADGPIFVLEHLFGLSERELGKPSAEEKYDSFKGFFALLRAFHEQKEPRELTPELLPDLVTFSDVNDPLTVTFVEPTNMSTALGAGVQFKRATIEITGDSITNGTSNRLPWLSRIKNTLAGGVLQAPPGDFSNIAKVLTKYDFYAKGY